VLTMKDIEKLHFIYEATHNKKTTTKIISILRSNWLIMQVKVLEHTFRASGRSHFRYVTVLNIAKYCQM
jgi:hypothetical protein